MAACKHFAYDSEATVNCTLRSLGHSFRMFAFCFAATTQRMSNRLRLKIKPMLAVAAEDRAAEDQSGPEFALRLAAACAAVASPRRGRFFEAGQRRKLSLCFS